MSLSVQRSVGYGRSIIFSGILLLHALIGELLIIVLLNFIRFVCFEILIVVFPAKPDKVGGIIFLFKISRSC